MPDDLIDDEPQELLAELGIEAGCVGQLTETGDLLGLAVRIGRGEPHLGLVLTDPFRDLEPFGQQVNERGVDVVDAGPAVAEYLVLVHPASVPSGRTGRYGAAR